jgi:hypothetical protein
MALLFISIACDANDNALSAVPRDGDADVSRDAHVSTLPDGRADAGCDGAVWGAPSKICDGSTKRRLSMVVVSDLGRVGGEQMLLFENGGFVHVTGDCRYWVGGGYGRTLTGLLGDFEAKLASDIFYGQWVERGLAKNWGPPDGLFDASATTFSDGNDRLAVAYAGGAGVIHGAPPEVYALWRAAGDWTQRLMATGTPVQGPLRIVVYDGYPTLAVPPATWPLSWPLSSVSLVSAQALGPGEGNVLISDTSDVSKIIPIWEEYLSGSHGTYAQQPPLPFVDAIPPSDGGSAADANAFPREYSVVIRDTIPLEDASGIIPPL